MRIEARHVWEEVKGYFDYYKRSAYVTFTEVSYESGGLYTDGFSIYICKRGKCKSHFGTIEWSDVDLIIETLETSKKHVELEVETGMASSKLFIPKWAKKKIIHELEERKKSELTTLN